MATKGKSEKWYGLDDLERRLGPMTVGRFIKAFRECDEITQAEYSKRLGISKANLCDIEKGRKLVSVERAARFAKLLGVPDTILVQLALQDQLRQAKLKLKVEVHAA
jgi:transcriptional regulator with XRE-family HTH domain